MCPPPSASPSPRGPVLRASLRANAAPFTPSTSTSTTATGHVEVVHNSFASSGSQPAIQRRLSQNPTFHSGKKRVSVHGNIASGRRNRVSQPADQNAAPNNNVAPKVEAKSFASEAFKKNAAKAYLAKKRAQEISNSNPIVPTGNKKDDARKAFARRQSQKLLKRQAAEDRNKRIDQQLELEAQQQQNQSSATSTTTTTTSTAQIVADVCNISTSSLTSSRPTSTSSSASVDPPVATNNNINLTSHENELLSTPDTNSNIIEAAGNVDTNDANISNLSIADVPIEQPVTPTTTTANTRTTNSTSTTPSTAPAPDLSINITAVNSSSIEPKSATVPKSAPVAPTASTLAPSNSMSIIPSCSVDIAQMPRASVSEAMSSCTMSTVSGGSSFDGASTTRGKRGKQTAMMPSSGKWCDDCAGVGLHIAAMMTTISSWRAEEERRSSNTSTSGKTTSSSSSGGGWKRRMSQTLIGVSHTSHASSKTPSDVQREKQRLEQQVDVLTLTVQFLYERLQKQGAATADVTDAVRRCT